MMSLLTFFAAVGCADTKFARPPLNDPPKLTSLEKMDNPRTHEAGFWMNRTDMEATADFFSHVRTVKDNWK